MSDMKQRVALVSSNIVLIDWDNTMRGGFTLVDWVSFLADSNLFDKGVAAEILDTIKRHGDGELTYEEMARASTALYANGLAGYQVAAVEQAALKFVQLDQVHLHSFVSSLLAALKGNDMTIVVVSGCPVEPLEAYKDILNLDHIYALQVGVSGGKYVAELVENPAGFDGKKAVVERLTESGDSVALAMGDSSADLPLLNAANYGIVVDNPSLMESSPTIHHISSEADLAEFDGILHLVESAQESWKKPQ